MKRLYCFTAGFLLLTVRAEKEDFQGFLTKQTKGTPVREDLLLRRENTIGHGTEAIPQENSHQHTAVALTAKTAEAELFDTKPTHPYKTTRNTKEPTMTALPNGEHLAVKNGKNKFPLTRVNPSATRIHGPEEPLISNNEKIVLTSIQAVFESIMRGTFQPKVSLSANTEKTSYWLHDNRNQSHTDPVALTPADGEPAAPVLSTSHPRVIDNLAALRNDDDDKRSQGEDEKGISNLGGDQNTSGVMQSFFRGETRRDPVRGNTGTSLCLTCQEEQKASPERSAAVPALSPDGPSDSLRTQGPALDLNQFTASLNLQLVRGQKAKQNKVINHQNLTNHSSFAQSKSVVPLNLAVNNILNNSLSHTRTTAFQAQSLTEMSPVMQDETRKQSRETYSREFSVAKRPNSTITVLQGTSNSHSTLVTLLKNEDKEMFGSINRQQSNKSIKTNASHGLSAMFDISFQHIQPLMFSSGSTSNKIAIAEAPDSRRGRGVLPVGNDNNTTSHPKATKTLINGDSEVSLSGITTVRVSNALTSRGDFLLSILRSQSPAKPDPQTKQPMIMSLSLKDSTSQRHEPVSQKLNTLKSGAKLTEVSVMRNLIPTFATAKTEITSKLHLSQPRPDELMLAQTVQTNTSFSERLTTMRFSPIVYNSKPGGVSEQVMNADEDMRSNETKDMLELKEEKGTNNDDKFGNKMEYLLLSDEMENERQAKTATSDVGINQNTDLEAVKMDELKARPIGKRGGTEQWRDLRQNKDEIAAREIDVTEINALTSTEEQRESLLKEGAVEKADKEDFKHKEEAGREGRTNAPLGPGANSFADSSDIGHSVTSQMSDLRAPELSNEISFSKETSTHIQSEITNNGSTFSKVGEGAKKEVSELAVSTATANTSTRQSESYRVSTPTIPAHVSTHKSAPFVPKSLSDMLTFTTIGLPQAQVKEKSFRKEGEEETTDGKDLKHEGGIGREDRTSAPLGLGGNSVEVSDDHSHPITTLSDRHGLMITEQKNTHLSAQMKGEAFFYNVKDKLGLLHSTLRYLGPKPSSMTSIPFWFHPHKTTNHGSRSSSEERNKKNVEALFSVTATPKTLPKLHKTFEGSTPSVLSQIIAHKSSPTVPCSVSNMLSITTLGFIQAQKQGEGKMADMKDLKQNRGLNGPLVPGANSGEVSGDKGHPVESLSDHHSLIKQLRVIQQKNIHLSAQTKSEAFFSKVTSNDEQLLSTLRSQGPKPSSTTSISTQSHPSESTNHGSTFSPHEENAKKNDVDTSFSPKASPKTLPSYFQLFGGRTPTILLHISQHRSHLSTAPNSFSNALSITPSGYLQAQGQNEFIKKEGESEMAVKVDLKQNKDMWGQDRTNAPLGLGANSVEVNTDEGHPVKRPSDHRLMKHLGVTGQTSIDLSTQIKSEVFFNEVTGNHEELHSTVLSESPRPSSITSSPIQAHLSETTNHGSSSSPEERAKTKAEALFFVAATPETLPKLQKMLGGSTTTIPPHISPHRSIPTVPNSVAYMSRDISGFLRAKDENDTLKKEGKETSDKEEGRNTAPLGAGTNSTKVSSEKEHPVSCLSNQHSLIEPEGGTKHKSVHLSAQTRSVAFYDKVTGTDEKHHLTLTSQTPKTLLMTSIPIHHSLSETTNHGSTFLPAKDSAKKEVVEAPFLPTKASKVLQIFGITSPTIIPQSKLAPPLPNSVSGMLSVTAKGILRAQPHSTASSPSLSPSIIQSFLDERQDLSASVLNENLILTRIKESTERSLQENTDKSSVLGALTLKVNESMPVMLNDFPSRPPTAAAKMTAGKFQLHQGQPAPKTTQSASSDMISGQPCTLKLSQQEARSDHLRSPVHNNEQRSVQAQMSAMSPKARSNQFPLSGASPLLNPELFGSDSLHITYSLAGLTGSTTERHVGYGNRGGGSLLVDSDETNQAENDSQQPQKTSVNLSTKAETRDPSNADEFHSLSLKQTEKLAVKHTNESNHNDPFSESNNEGNNTAPKSNHLFQLGYNGTSSESTSMKEQAINENFVPVMKDTATPVHDSNDQTDKSGDSMPEIPIILANDASKNTISDIQHLTEGGIGVEHDLSTPRSLVGEGTLTSPHINFSKDLIIPIKSTQQLPDQIMTAGTEFQITTTKLNDFVSVPLADHMGSHILSPEAYEAALTTPERVVAEESSVSGHAEHQLQTNNQMEPTPGNLTPAVKRGNMIETRNLEPSEREILIQDVERAQHALPGEIEITRPFNIPQQGVRADLFNSAGEAHITTPTVGKGVRSSMFNKVKTSMMTTSTFGATHPPLDVYDDLMKHVLPEKTSISPIDIEAVSDMGTFLRRGPIEINNKSSCGTIDCADSVKRSKTDEFKDLQGNKLKAQAAYMQTDHLNTSDTPAMAPESSNYSTNSPLPGTLQATVPAHADLSSASSKSDRSHAPVDEIMTQKINSLTHKPPTITQQLTIERALLERKRIHEWSAKTTPRNFHSETAKVTLSELEASTVEVTEQIVPTEKNTITQLNRKAGAEILEAQKATRSAHSSSKGEAALTESGRRSLLPEQASVSELLRVKPRGRSAHLHLSGVTEVSDDLCGSGNYTAEMTLSLGGDLEPGDAVPALGNLRVIINLKTNNSRLNLGVTSCCLSPTIRPDLSNATCCLFSRLAAEPAGITLLPAALPTSASFTISLFQMINYSLAYLHCDLSVCPRNRSDCERCLQQRSVAPAEGLRAVVTNVRNRISFGPVLKEVKNSTFPQEIDPSELDLVLVIISMVVTSSVVTVMLLLVWLTYRHRAIWPLQSAAPPGTRRCCCCCRLRPGGDLILP